MTGQGVDGHVREAEGRDDGHGAGMKRPRPTNDACGNGRAGGVDGRVGRNWGSGVLVLGACATAVAKAKEEQRKSVLMLVQSGDNLRFVAVKIEE